MFNELQGTFSLLHFYVWGIPFIIMYLPIFLSILAFFLRCPKIANTEKIQLSKVGIIFSSL